MGRSKEFEDSLTSAWRNKLSVQLSDWTILIYIAAHNNLDHHASNSLNQILAAGSSERVKVAVLFDSWLGATRYIAGGPGTPAVEEKLGSFDSGRPDELFATAQWVYEKHPAKQYGLVLWSHGDGYWDQKELVKIAKKAQTGMIDSETIVRSVVRPSMALFSSTLEEIMREVNPDDRAILFDDGTQHSLDTLQLAQVMAELHQRNWPIALLGMDACLMGNIEVAYELRNTVRYMVASEELVPGTSWPYDTILGRLHQQPDMAAGDLAQHIVGDYAAYYRANPPAFGTADVTKVALDLARIGELQAPIKALADTLRAHMDEDHVAFHAAQLAAFKQETYENRRDWQKSKFGYHLWDLRTLAVGIAAQTQRAELKAAAEAVAAGLKPGGVVMAEAHEGAWFDGIGGVSVYMAPGGKPLSAKYRGLAFARDTGWWEVLKGWQGEAG